MGFTKIKSYYHKRYAVASSLAGVMLVILPFSSEAYYIQNYPLQPAPMYYSGGTVGGVGVVGGGGYYGVHHGYGNGAVGNAHHGAGSWAHPAARGVHRR